MIHIDIARIEVRDAPIFRDERAVHERWARTVPTDDANEQRSTIVERNYKPFPPEIVRTEARAAGLTLEPKRPDELA